jgi:hypothetical protein
LSAKGRKLPSCMCPLLALRFWTPRVQEIAIAVVFWPAWSQVDLWWSALRWVRYLPLLLSKLAALCPHPGQLPAREPIGSPLSCGVSPSGGLDGAAGSTSLRFTPASRARNHTSITPTSVRSDRNEYKANGCRIGRVSSVPGSRTFAHRSSTTRQLNEASLVCTKYEGRQIRPRTELRCR